MSRLFFAAAFLLFAIVAIATAVGGNVAAWFTPAGLAAALALGFLVP